VLLRSWHPGVTCGPYLLGKFYGMDAALMSFHGPLQTWRGRSPGGSADQNAMELDIHRVRTH
jgi:hypothetical protein